MSASLLLLIGGIIGLGFLGSVFFEKTRIPDVFLLISIGLLLGPILGIVPVEGLRPLMPVFGTLALTIILFEGGLDLDLQHAFRQAGRALLLAVLSFTVSAFLIYYAIFLGLNASGNSVWGIAAAMACTSAPIVIPVLSRLAPRSPLHHLLAMESALSDALAVMVVLALISETSGDLSGAALAGQIGRSMLIGVGAAAVGGILWLLLLTRLYKRSFFYLMTLGFVFLLMGLVETAHGSGAISALLFGVILANGESLVGFLGSNWRKRIMDAVGGTELRLHPRISQSHSEVSFMVRAFFFVYLGIIFRWPGADFKIWFTIGLVVFAVVVAREIAVHLTGWIAVIPARHRLVMAGMLPRGLATAVLASLLAGRPPEYGGAWETLATFVVLISNLWMTLRLIKLRSVLAGTTEDPA
jgi:cell volume regulation protein A